MRIDRLRLPLMIMMVAFIGGVAPARAQSKPEPSSVPVTESAQSGPDSVTAEAPEPAAARPMFRAGVLSLTAQRAMRIDGRLTEAVWATEDSIANLTTVEPEEGGVPAGRTVVKVVANRDEIVIGIRCFDDPAGIVSFSKSRDAELDEEDNVLMVLDTFGDQRSGYVFAINPDGSRFDGLITAQGDDVNSSWNTDWEAATSRDAGGWSAEFRLPITSLTFKKGLTRWGFNVERRVQRLQETSRWSGAKLDFEIFQMSQAGVLSGLPSFDLGHGLLVRPAVVFELARPEAGDSQEFNTDFSLDVNQKLGSNLTATMSVNTDFAETEADARQTNLSRFDILFPEKRAFFLEGADIFEFGLGTDLEAASVLPFFSRRIGLFTPEGEDEGTEVPILVGGKLQGRIGSSNVGALVVATDRFEDALGAAQPPAEMGVVRLRQNVLSESSIGMIATFGDPLDRRSWLGGADFTYRTSAFRGEKNLVVGAWGLATDHEDLVGDLTDRAAYGGKIGYPNDKLDLGLTYSRIGDEFDPSLGFVTRTGHIFDATSEYNLRPEGTALRRLAFGLTYFRAMDIDGIWESYSGVAKPIDLLFESGDRLEATVQWEGEQPTEDFDIFALDASAEKTVVIPAGAYDWTRYGMTAVLAPKRMISGEATWSIGSFYDGDLQALEASLVLKPASLLTIGLTLERNDATFPERADPADPHDFTQYLYSGRAEFNFTPNFQITTFVQYDNESRSLGSAPRLRWTFHPLGDLFVSFNHNMTRSYGVDPEHWNFASDQLLVKIQRGLRW